MRKWYIAKVDSHDVVMYANSNLRISTWHNKKGAKNRFKPIQYKELLKRFPRWFLGKIRKESKSWPGNATGFNFRMW